MSRRALPWAPAVVLSLGALVTVGVPSQRALPLRMPLSGAISREIAGFQGRDVAISEGEAAAAAFTEYLMRVYEPAGSAGAGQPEESGRVVGGEGTQGDRDAPGSPAPWFSVYVGYYDSQTQGKTIHSPRNCLPGAGWEALGSMAATVPTEAGDVVVNRYLLQRENERALVLYWYQGRGRVEANEYRVKLDLLLDAAVSRRSEEALVRIVVPLRDSEERALDLATSVASRLVPAVSSALPI